MQPRALTALLAFLTVACGGREQPTSPVPPPSAPEPPAATHEETETPSLPPAERFACEHDDECILDCALGAISLAWLSQQPPRAACEDGCAGPDSSAPRCVSGACAAFHRDGAPMPECSEREATVTAAPPLSIDLEPLTRGQSTGIAPEPYVMLRIHNRSDTPQRVELFAAELWVTRGRHELALPLAPERMELQSLYEDGEPISRESATWLEWVTLPPHASRDVTVFTSDLDAAPPNAFPYRLRITFRDEAGGMARVDASIQRVIRDPVRQ